METRKPGQRLKKNQRKKLQQQFIDTCVEFSGMATQ